MSTGSRPRASSTATSRFHWLDLTTLVGLGGIWLALFIGQLKTRSLVPVNDPYLAEALGNE